MASYQQQMQDIFRRYQEEVSTEPVDLRDVGAWAIENKLWAPQPVDMHSRFAADMAEALREEYRVDKDGRRYRSKLAVRGAKDGRQGSFWGDIDTAPRPHVEKNVAQRRRQIVGDCYQLQVDVDHYNGAHPDEEQLDFFKDFTDDVVEEMAKNGIESKAA